MNALKAEEDVANIMHLASDMGWPFVKAFKSNDLESFINGVVKSGVEDIIMATLTTVILVTPTDIEDFGETQAGGSFERFEVWRNRRIMMSASTNNSHREEVLKEYRRRHPQLMEYQSPSDVINEEGVTKEDVQKATMAFSMAEARLQFAVESLESVKETGISVDDSVEGDTENGEKNGASVSVEEEKEVDRLSEVAESSQMNALKAEEDVANIMHLAEQAVTFEVEATKHVNDAKIALERAEKLHELEGFMCL
ncbi:hypothetical protein IFM89_015476 [Coptis chinensis]|uniref:Uncharacterized protein n=1 Tax=Coptis chinensis TaxID=261450 RepID=A0A835GWL2_9MAGN|nr:hypothetical protein IFM89_015476 [Coptis chinensis]